MRRFVLLVAVTVLAVMPSPASARGHGGHTASGTTSSHSGGTTRSPNGGHGSGHPGTTTHRATSHAPNASSPHTGSQKAPGVQRDARGKIQRDPEQKAKFKRTHPCPSTGKTGGACPGYVVDHVQALKHGGRDDPSNMQWQTVQQGKAKDKVE